MTSDLSVPTSRDAALSAYRRGDPEAAALLSAALDAHPLDGGLLIADAALAQEQGREDALDRLEEMLARAPDWLDGHVALAQLRWGAGARDDFLGAIEAALQALPRHAGLWMRYMTLLAESGQPLRAADVAAQLRATGGDAAALRLIEARYAGLAAEHVRAGALIATLPPEMPGLAYAGARHRLQLGDAEGSVPLLDRARVEGGDCLSWALTELAWRATGDPRHAWLIDSSMIRAVPLGLSPAELAELAEDLRWLHARRWPALGQSARGATQTRGNLLDLCLPAISRFSSCAHARLKAYRAALPVADPAHPLFASRDAEATIDTAWSIRIDGSGHHVSHVHPGGIISSACHIASPASSGPGDRSGWLELGRPPADIPLALEPIASFPPVAGQLILFPSYLYHGTTPIATGERLALAFDVA